MPPATESWSTTQDCCTRTAPSLIPLWGEGLSRSRLGKRKSSRVGRKVDETTSAVDNPVGLVSARAFASARKDWRTAFSGLDHPAPR